VTRTPISHAKHDVPGADGIWRPGATSHEESGTDLRDYLRPLEQVHAGALHGSGVAEGLTLSAVPGGTTVRVGPGVAVDPTGRHIVLTPGGPAEISDRPDEDSRLVTIGDSGIEVPATGRSGSCVVAVLWRETLDEQLATGVVQQFVERHTPWLRIYSEGVPPDDLAVVLGTVALDNGVVRAPGAGVGDRHGILLGAEGLRLRTAATGPAGVTDTVAGQLAARPGGGVTLRIDDPTGLEVSADRTAFRGADDAERLSLDAGRGRIGVAAPQPSHPLHVGAVTGIRQNSLYFSGGPGWSSLSYNAHHDEANGAWVFPDPTRPAVTVEMDDAGGTPRFEVFSTSTAAPTTWVRRLAINGNTGAVQIAGAVSVDRDEANAVTLFSANRSGTAMCASSGDGTGLSAVGGQNAIVAIGPSNFTGAVNVVGTFTATNKQFVIDHPLDPENKTLAHATVESDERVNVYSGNVVLDADGAAVVALPPWAESLNTDFRYQLTCIGRAAPVHVSREVSDGSFGIAGGAAGMTVSWQLTGVRNDPWAQQHPFEVEEDKAEAERGSYRHPDVYGHPAERSVSYVRYGDALRRNPRLARQVMTPGFGSGRAY